jgi:hypothetical protein
LGYYVIFTPAMLTLLIVRHPSGILSFYRPIIAKQQTDECGNP